MTDRMLLLWRFRMCQVTLITTVDTLLLKTYLSIYDIIVI
ncbi:hypothetical protein VPHF99_0079 [Vibrio phage F99]